MTTQSETAGIGNIPMEGDSQNLNPDLLQATQGFNVNIGGEGAQIQSSIPMGQGVPFEAGTTESSGVVMGVGGGVLDNAPDVTFSTRNADGTAFGTMKTTTTTTTTQYGMGGQSGMVANYQLGQGADGGVIMGVDGGVQDDAADVTYSTKTGMEGGLGAAAALGQTTTTTTTTTQYGLRLRSCCCLRTNNYNHYYNYSIWIKPRRRTNYPR